MDRVFTREEAYAALAGLNPAPVFLESYRSRSLPENLEIFFGPPEELFLDPGEQALYTGGRLIPILDDGNFGVVTFVDPDSKSLVQMPVEEPESSWEFSNWQQYLAAVMIDVNEIDLEDDNARRHRISELIGFRYMDRLEEFWSRADIVPDGNWSEACRQFTLTIPP